MLDQSKWFRELVLPSVTCINSPAGCVRDGLYGSSWSYIDNLTRGHHSSRWWNESFFFFAFWRTMPQSHGLGYALVSLVSSFRRKYTTSLCIYMKEKVRFTLSNHHKIWSSGGFECGLCVFLKKNKNIIRSKKSKLIHVK